MNNFVSPFIFFAYLTNGFLSHPIFFFFVEKIESPHIIYPYNQNWIYHKFYLDKKYNLLISLFLFSFSFFVCVYIMDLYKIDLKNSFINLIIVNPSSLINVIVKFFISNKQNITKIYLNDKCFITLNLKLYQTLVGIVD